jgi:hypothetical protein
MTVCGPHVGHDFRPRVPRAEPCAVWDAEPMAESAGIPWNPMWNQHLSAAVRDARVTPYGRYVTIRLSQLWPATGPNRKPIAYFAPSSMRRWCGAPIPHSSLTSDDR